MRKSIIYILLCVVLSHLSGVEAFEESIDLGKITASMGEKRFSLRVKSDSDSCPIIESACGCTLVMLDLATRGPDGWWSVPVERTFGMESGADVRLISVKDTANGDPVKIKIKSDIAPVSSVSYSGILKWSVSEKKKRVQSVDTDFSQDVSVTSVTATPRPGCVFLADIKKSAKDGSRWTVVITPKTASLEQTPFPDMIDVAFTSNSPRVKKIVIAAMVLPAAK